MSALDDLRSIPPQLLADGFLARAVHGEQLTLAVVEVEPDAKLPEHRHVNEQLGMVIEGSVVFRVGAESGIVQAGGIWRIPADTSHSHRWQQRSSRPRRLLPSTRRLGRSRTA